MMLPTFDDELLGAYLRRIGAEHEPPSIEALCRLHRAHQMSLSHESTWIHFGERWTLDPLAAVRRFVNDGRGGYCYHLNGGFASLLHTLGYDVTLHMGTVYGEDRPIEYLGNHAVVQVANLASNANPEGRWHIDVGLGEGLLEPIPLIPGTYAQAPVSYELARAAATDPAEHGDWRLRVDHPYCNVRNVAFDSSPVSLDSFAAHHQEQSTSSTSMFVAMLLAHRRDDTGIDSLIGLNLGRVESVRTQQILETSSDWFAALADVFHITLTDTTAEQRETLWRKTLTAHEAWKQS